MKKISPILLAILLLTLCACTKEPAQEPSVQDALAQANTVEEPAPEEVKSEEPPEEPPQELPEEPAPPAVPTPELLQLRLEHASLCTCLMEQGARWHLMQVGALEETEEDAPFLSAIAAMEEELTAHPEDFAAVAENTLWLLDSTPEGGFVLEFIQAGPEEDTACCRSLLFDGEGTRYQAEAELLESPYFSSCADAATEEEHQQTLETYDRLSEDDLQSRFWRVSIATGSQLSLAAFSFSDAQATSYHAFPSGCPSGKLILNASDIATEEPDELVLACLRMNLDECGAGEGDIMLLRGFLAMHLPDDGSFWDEPGPTDSDYSWFYDVRNALQLFLRDLRADETLAAEFLARENWALLWNPWDTSCGFVLTAQGPGDTLTVHFYPGGIDMEGYQTPSRKNLERLALEGENSELVPEDVREQFVFGVLCDWRYGRMMSGEFGEAKWSWRVVDGEIQLVVDMSLDSRPLRVVGRLITTERGEQYLSTDEEELEVNDGH